MAWSQSKNPVIYEVLDQEILGFDEDFRRFCDFVEGGNRRAKNMEQREDDLIPPGHLEEADVAQRVQGRGQGSGPNIEQSDLRTG